MIEFFNEIMNWLDVGIYDWIKETYAWLVVEITILKLEFQMLAMVFAWDVASEIIQQLDITGEIESAIHRLPSVTIQQLYFFNVIEGVNLALNALVTRFVLRFMGM